MTPQQRPLSLQQILNEASWGYSKGETVLKSDMEVGPPKRRRRTTKSVDIMSCSITVDAAEYATFENFYDTTIAAGTIPFIFNHPIKGTYAEWKFDGSFRASSLGAGIFQISMTWELQN